MKLLAALLAGLLFGAGLLLSGMANPAKVIGFLDLAGRWDPSLALVMAGAISIAFFAFRAARGRRQSLLGADMQLPTARHVDRRLVLGSLAFGIGWGVAGFCPGPAIVALGIGSAQAWIFVPAMLAGMALYEILQRMNRHE